MFSLLLFSLIIPPTIYLFPFRHFIIERVRLVLHSDKKSTLPTSTKDVERVFMVAITYDIE